MYTTMIFTSSSVKMSKSSKKFYQVESYVSDARCIFWRYEDKNPYLEYSQDKEGSFKNKPNCTH